MIMANERHDDKFYLLAYKVIEDSWEKDTFKAEKSKLKICFDT